MTWPLLRSVLVCVLVLGACTDRAASPVVPDALSFGQPVTVFAATSRSRNPDGSFGFERSEKLRHVEMVVSVPPTHSPGDLRFGYGDPDPRNEFTLAARTEFGSVLEFKNRLRRELKKLPPDSREITVFIHGYNSTQAEAAFRAAQLKYDIEVPGLLVLYSWPSRGRALAYAYDSDSILFARDGMESLLSEVTDVGATRVLLVAHSMGSAVAMETIRQMDLASPGWAARELSSVVLVSPDLDVDVFRAQMSRISKVPNPFVIFTSRKDKILGLSSRLRGTQPEDRLGSIDDIQRVMDLPIEIIDTTAFSDNAASGHFVAATSPALIAMIRKARSVSQMFDVEETSLGAILSGRPDRQSSAKEFVISSMGLSAR